MKQNTWATLPPIVLAPPALTPDAVKEHITSLIDLGLSAPDAWNPRLALAAAKLTVDLEVTESGLRHQRMLADLWPDLSDQGKAAARVEIALAQAAASATHRLGVAARPVFEAACAASEARSLLDRITGHVATSEAGIARASADIELRHKPRNEDENKAIQALDDERRHAERAIIRSSSGGSDEVEDELRDLFERKKYQWEPTKEGYLARMDKIEEEIERLQEIIDEAPDPFLGQPTVSDLLGTIRELEESITERCAVLGETIKREEAAARGLALEEEVFHLKAGGIIRCHELACEAGKLAGESQDSPA